VDEGFLNKYITYLDQNFSIDYWSDEGINHAVALLEQFSASDWENLEKALLTKGDFWATRCAETLGESESKSAFDVLLALVSSKSNEVKIAALDTINSLMSQGFEIDNSVEKIRAAVSSVRNTADSVSVMALDSLEKKLR
jgi:HEAT repeat protein